MNLPELRVKCQGRELDADLPSVWQGRALEVACGFFLGENQSETSFWNVSTFEFRLYRFRIEGTELLTATLLPDDMATNGAIDPAAWADGTAEHLRFRLTGADMEFALLGVDERLWWTVCSVLNTNQVITSAAGYLTVREEGALATAPEIPPVGTSVSVNEGFAAATVVGELYQWVVTSADGNIPNGVGAVQVVDGIATLELDGTPCSWPVVGAPGTSGPLETFYLSVAGGIGTFIAGGNPYTMPVLNIGVAPPTGPIPVLPGTTLVTGSDGAEYEKTVYSDGTVRYKPVYEQLP